MTGRDRSPAGVPVAAGLPRRAPASPGFTHGRWAPVEFWVSWPRPCDLTAKVRSGEATRIEAAALARDIRALHDEAGAGWDEFGVLVRSTGDLDVYLQSLRDADIPYVVERDRSYYRRREIIDAAALVRTVLDPADHLALVTVLRSAIVGVPDAALMPLWSRGLPALLTELHGADGRRLGAVEAGGARGRRVAAGRAFRGSSAYAGGRTTWSRSRVPLGVLRESFERDPAVEFLERLRTATLLEATEAARPLGRFRVANLERFFRRLLERRGGDRAPTSRACCARCGRRSPSSARARRRDPVHAGEDAVRILTIHKAKGLDFRPRLPAPDPPRRAGRTPNREARVGGGRRRVRIRRTRGGDAGVGRRRRSAARGRPRPSSCARSTSR